ncbi:hypothetical protein CCY99_08915, partial [Helicobacter sp. 16-1353]|uniref:sulfatase-like hydrolase/transferase n=1 Tax=Helicobacter sp. 16-1353 TaxID=2004996 RepID=UPI000DCD8F3D
MVKNFLKHAFSTKLTKWKVKQGIASNINSLECEGGQKYIFANYAILAFATFICFLAPGLIFGIFVDYSFRLDYITLLAFVPFSLILPLVVPRFAVYVILAMFATFELVQFGHLFYFGAPLSPFSISLIMLEMSEILESSTTTFPNSLIVPFCVLIPYVCLMVLYAKSARFGKIKGVVAFILVIFALSILPHKALFKTPRIANFMPNNNAMSLYNSLVSFSGYFFILLVQNGGGQNENMTTYKPYIIKDFSPDSKDSKQDSANFTQDSASSQDSTRDSKDSKNVVIILGESLNAKHLSLLGYARETTPRLEKLKNDDRFFYATTALSSSILTRNAMNMFFNVSYEHNNIFHITTEHSHLVKLAKQKGFKTFYLSNQTIAELPALSPKHLDTIITKEDNHAKSEEIGDMILLDLLDSKIDEFKSGKNLIIIHQRSSHSPYERNYRAYEKAGIYPISNVDMESYKLNSYDNSVIFNDFIIASIFEKFRNLDSKIPSFVFFVADHGEATGRDLKGNKNGIWGHAVLEESVVFVPFLSSVY